MLQATVAFFVIVLFYLVLQGFRLTFFPPHKERIVLLPTNQKEQKLSSVSGSLDDWSVFCDEPIDAVYTWVNGSDPHLYEQIKRVKHELSTKGLSIVDIINNKHSNKTLSSSSSSSTVNNDLKKDKDNGEESKNRYRDSNELLYSLRSLEKFAPWIRHVYIVTNGQVPTWLNLDFPGVTIIPHEVIFPNVSHLPTFSSPAIESHLHRIEGLSKRFIYFNDDVFLGAPIFPDDFFTLSRGSKVYLAWDIPDCAAGCSDAWIGDGWCDISCNITACNFDGGDCAGKPPSLSSLGTNRGIDSTFDFDSFSSFNDDKITFNCAHGCRVEWIGDRMCDSLCNNADCGFDGGDCKDTKIDDWQKLPQAHQPISFISPGVKILSPSTKLEIPIHMNVSATQSGSEFKNKENNSSISNSIVLQWPMKIAALNLTEIFGLKGKVTMASHDNPSLIKSALLIQKHKLLLLYFGQKVSYGKSTKKGKKKSKAIVEMPLDLEKMRVSVELEGDSTTLSASKTSIIAHINITFIPPPPTAEDDDLSSNNSSHSSNTTGVVARKIKKSKKEINGIAQIGNKTSSTGRRKLGGFDDPYFSDDFEDGDDEGFDIDDKGDEVRDPLPRNSDGTISTKTLNETTINATVPQVLDMFSTSLRHTYKVLSTKFTSSYSLNRKVPAHMPHMIDKDIMSRLQKVWPSEFDKTSSHQFRSIEDMQYAYAYFSYLMAELRSVDLVDVCFYVFTFFDILHYRSYFSN